MPLVLTVEGVVDQSVTGPVALVVRSQSGQRRLGDAATGKSGSSRPFSISRGRGATSPPRSTCSMRPSMPNSTWDPHMFHGILCASDHEEKYPLTTAAATRRSVAARNRAMVPP